MTDRAFGIQQQIEERQMQQLRVEIDDDAGAVGVIDVPDDWSVVAADRTRAMASPPAGLVAGDGFLPGMLVRIEGADASDDDPDGVLVLSDHQELTPDGVRRTRCVLLAMMGEAVIEMVTTIRTPDVLLSVVCTSLDTQWEQLAATFDSSASTARIDASRGVEEPA